MSNVPYLAAHRDKRAGKEECFGIIRRMSAGSEATESELAALYSYFLPPKPKKITDPFEWAASACDDKANYAFCKYVESANGCLAAANTRTAHIVLSDMGLKPGFYDTGKGYAGDDVAIMPDYFTAMSEAQTDGAYADFDLESLEICDTASGLVYVLPWNGRGVYKSYFDVMLRSLSDIQVLRNNAGAFCVTGSVRGVPVCAVIMPGEVVRL